MLCRSSAISYAKSFVVFLLIFFHLPESSSWQRLQAWLLAVSARGQPTSVTAFSLFWTQIAFLDLRINSPFVTWWRHNTPSIFSIDHWWNTPKDMSCRFPCLTCMICCRWVEAEFDSVADGASWPYRIQSLKEGHRMKIRTEMLHVKWVIHHYHTTTCNKNVTTCYYL